MEAQERLLEAQGTMMFVLVHKASMAELLFMFADLFVCLYWFFDLFTNVLTNQE